MLELTQIQTLLHNFPLFAAFSTEESFALAKLMDPVQFHAGEVIVRQNDPVSSVYLIVEGSAEVSQHVANETKPVLLAVLRPGESIGLDEAGFFSKTGLRTATVTAVSDMQLLQLSLTRFNLFLQHYPELNQTMAQTANHMLRMQLIKKAAPFAKLSKERIEWLAQHIGEQEIEAGKIIFHQGDKSESCYLIYSGQVLLYTVDDHDQEHAITTLKSSALFGEMALVTDTPRRTSARALETTKLLVLQKTDLLNLITQDKKFTDDLTTTLLEHVRLFNNKSVIAHKKRSSDGEVITVLQNREKNTYYQLSKEGWYIYHFLDGHHTLSDISKKFHKEHEDYDPHFVYELVADLVEGGFAVYTEDVSMDADRITIISYDAENYHEINCTRFDPSTLSPNMTGVNWMKIEGLHNPDLLKQLSQFHALHPKTLEDILSSKQRVKVEMFETYIYMTFASLSWNKQTDDFDSNPIKIVFGKNFIFSFQTKKSTLFTPIKELLDTRLGRQLREHHADYLTYRLLDRVVDQYFMVLSHLNERIAQIEETVFFDKKLQQNLNEAYNLKHQILTLYRAIWPLRDAINNLIHHADPEWVSDFTIVYLKDLYDRITQVVDSLDNFRDEMVSIFEAYINRRADHMNEIMKVLTIIASIFIPAAWLAGVFGMNFVNIPLLQNKWGFAICLLIMLGIAVGMVIYYKRKKWI